MKLASLKGGRDGVLVVVRRDGASYAPATGIAPTLQAALDDWERVEPGLRALADQLESGALPGQPLDPAALASPLPRAYEWLDASAFLPHVRLARKSRGADLPPDLLTSPLVYQGGSGALLAPTDPVLHRPEWGLDFEGEVCAILDDVPLGTTPAEATRHVRLVCLANDVTLRELVPAELTKGFGFVQSKPATAFSPFALTVDELGSAWRAGRLHLSLRVVLNGTVVGTCDAGAMHFSFYDLIAHVAHTRRLTAGTILGSGTVSNDDPARGVSCLVERRMREKVEGGAPRTPWLSPGDRVQIEMLDGAGQNLFGTIDQTVVTA